MDNIVMMKYTNDFTGKYGDELYKDCGGLCGSLLGIMLLFRGKFLQRV